MATMIPTMIPTPTRTPAPLPRRQHPSWLTTAPGLEDEVWAVPSPTPTPTMPVPTPTPTPTVPLTTFRSSLAGGLRPVPIPTPTPAPFPEVPPAPGLLDTLAEGFIPRSPIERARRRMELQAQEEARAAMSAAVPTPTPEPPVHRPLEDIQRMESGLPTRSGVIPNKAGGMGTGNAPTSEPIRALRLPNGKLIFTNQPSSYAGAKEISTQDAGRMLRRDEISPAAAEDVVDGGPGFVNSAATDITRGEVEDEIAFDNAMRGNSLLRAMNERKLLQMPLEEQARMGSQVPGELQLMREILPQIVAARARQQEAMQIADPELRANAIEFENQKIEDLFRAAGIRQF